MITLKTSISLEPHNRTKSILILALKSSQGRPLTHKPRPFRSKNKASHCRPHTKICSTPIPAKKLKVDPLQWNQVKFDYPHKFFAHTKTKLFFATIQKPTQFRPPAQKLTQSILTLKQVMFGPYTKTKTISIPTLYIKSISICTQNRVNCEPHTKPKSISTPEQKTSQV